ILFFLVTLLLLTNINIDAAEQWTSDIGKQLVKEGWENYTDSKEEPLIIYSIYFLEVNSKLLDLFDYESEVSAIEGHSKGLRIIDEGEILELIKDYHNSYSLFLNGVNESKNSSSQFKSFLATMGTEPIKVELSTEDKVKDYIKSKLLLNIKPEKIDYKQKRIFTNLSFEFQSTSNQLAELKTKKWIGLEFDKPLGVISFQQESSDRSQNKYFALYAVSTLVSAGELDKNSSLVNVSDVSGLKELYSLIDRTSDNRFSIDSEKIYSLKFNENEKKIGFNYKAVNNYDIALGNLNNIFFYELGADYRISDNEDSLFLSGEISNSNENSEIVTSIGASDELTWMELFDIRMSYLPLRYNISTSELESSLTKIRLNYNFSRVSIWYEGEYIDKDLSIAIGIDGRLTDSFTIGASWEKTHDENDLYSLVLSYVNLSK
ncbi:MAG: hypothetical protein ACOCRO_08755, partial [Halanaerobiales bacterium]